MLRRGISASMTVRQIDTNQYRIGDWILVHFPSDESGRMRKLSRPWHGPYRVTSCTDMNITAKKVYFPDEDPIQIHQTRVKHVPEDFWLVTIGMTPRGKGQAVHQNGFKMLFRKRRPRVKGLAKMSSAARLPETLVPSQKRPPLNQVPMLTNRMWRLQPWMRR